MEWTPDPISDDRRRRRRRLRERTVPEDDRLFLSKYLTKPAKANRSHGQRSIPCLRHPEAERRLPAEMLGWNIWRRQEQQQRPPGQ